MLRVGTVSAAVLGLIFSLVSASPAFAVSYAFSGTITGPDVDLDTIKVRAVDANNGNTLSINTDPVNATTGEFTIRNIRKSRFKIKVSAKVDGVNRTWFWIDSPTKTGSPRLADATILTSNKTNAYLKFGTIKGTIQLENQAAVTPRVSVAANVAGTATRKAIVDARKFFVLDHSASVEDGYSIKFLPYRDDYLVSFRDTLLNFQEDWYNASVLGGAEFSGDANRLTLATPADAIDANFIFKRAYLITGLVKGDLDGGGYATEKNRHYDQSVYFAASVSPTHSVQVYRRNSATSYTRIASTHVNGSGSYQVKGLRRGVGYVVRYAGIDGKSRFQSEYYCQIDSSDHTIEGSWCNDPNNQGKLFENVAASNRQYIQVNDASSDTTVGLDPVTLNTGRQISGRVTKSTGYPRRKLAVRAYNSSGYASRWAYTDKNGNFYINGLTPGSYKIEVNPDAYTPTRTRRYYNGKYGGTASSGSATWVNVSSGNKNISRLYFNAMPPSSGALDPIDR